MRHIPCLLLIVILLALSGLGLFAYARLETARLAEQASSIEPPQAITLDGPAVVSAYCRGCHSNGRAKVDFDESIDPAALRRDPATWSKVLLQVRSREMPPPGRLQPTAAEREQLIQWLEQGLDAARLAAAQGDGIAVRRLSRTEYLNTVRDLLGVRFQPDDDFPADENSWDRYHAVPPLSAALLEKYQAAAARILHQAALPPITASPATENEDEESAVSFAPGSDCYFHMDQQRAPAPSAGAAANAASVRPTLAALAYRAYRRPPTDAEVDHLVALFDRASDAGHHYQAGLQAALQAVLTAPQFLFHVDTRAGADDSADDARRRDYALAARLSYFLWRSMPDEELLAQAEQGVLRSNLAGQALRLLQDGKARAFVKDFTTTWLGLNRLKFPADDVSLVRAMRGETERFAAHIMRDDRSVLEFLDADYTFLNERLAQHYGIPDVRGKQWRKVSVKEYQRGGLTTQASMLTITAPAGNPSPVQRGKWILENLLGTPPPAPPAGLLDAFNDIKRNFAPGSTRQRLEQHRANPSCAHCHAPIDALGATLENFDAYGAWRSQAGSYPIDPVGIMPNGESIHGPAQLKTHLLGKKDMLVRCLAGRLLSYALGRKLEIRDLAALDPIPQHVAQNQYRFSSVLLQVVLSEPFQSGYYQE